MRLNLERRQFDQSYRESCEQIAKKVDEFVHKGSGWIFSSVQQIDLHVFKYVPNRGGSYLPLPDWIQRKECCINIQNDDQNCFLYSILAALMFIDGRTKKNLHYLSHYKDHLDELNFSGLPMPMSLQDIPRFEKLNELCINVYSLNEKKNKILPLHISKIEKIRPINLLLLEEDNKYHYVWIKERVQ